MPRKSPFLNRKTEELLDVIGHIYETAVDDSLWSEALEKICKLVDAPYGNLSVIDFAQSNLNFMQGIRYDPEYLRTYDEYFLSVSPYREAFFSVPEQVHIGFENLPESDYVQTEYYNDWALPQGLHDDLGYIFNRDGGRMVILNCTRGRNAQRFGSAEMDTFRILAPHIKRVVDLRQRFWALQNQQDASLAVLERLRFGVILVDDEERPLHANPAAEDILGAGDGLCVTRGHFSAGLHGETQALRKLIHQAVLTGRGEAGFAGGTLALTRRSNAVPLSVLVSPLRAERHNLAPGRGRACAVVLVSDQDKPLPSAGEMLRLLYGLTPAEARLAEELVSGRSLSEASERLRISKATARNQLKAVFLKTDTHRQSALVQLALSTPATWFEPS